MKNPAEIGVTGRLLALVVMLVGSLVVFGMLVLMNRADGRRDGDQGGPVVDFTVRTEERRPEPPPRPPERRQPRRTAEPRLAPLPNLGGGLSSIQVEMPNFVSQGLGSGGESLLGNLEEVSMTEDTVDSVPVARNAPEPPYPDRAKQREIEGRVVVSALIGANGRVKNLKILEASPPGVFDEAVLNTVRNWTFAPATYKQEPVETWVTIPLNFNL